MPCRSRWTAAMVARIITQPSRSASWCSIRPTLVWWNGRRPAARTAATTSTTGITAEKSRVRTLVSQLAWTRCEHCKITELQLQNACVTPSKRPLEWLERCNNCSTQYKNKPPGSVSAAKHRWKSCTNYHNYLTKHAGDPLEPVLVTPFEEPRSADEEAFNRHSIRRSLHSWLDHMWFWFFGLCLTLNLSSDHIAWWSLIF